MNQMLGWTEFGGVVGCAQGGMEAQDGRGLDAGQKEGKSGVSGLVGAEGSSRQEKTKQGGEALLFKKAFRRCTLL